MFAPENNRIAPISRSAKLIIAVTMPRGPCKSALIVSQFAATAVAKPIAPATMSAKPRGMLAPENRIIAPIASKAADKMPVTATIGPFKAFWIALQSVLTAPQMASAPIAISPMPRGTFTPENANAAPIASRAAPVNNSMMALSWSLMPVEKSGALFSS